MAKVVLVEGTVSFLSELARCRVERPKVAVGLICFALSSFMILVFISFCDHVFDLIKDRFVNMFFQHSKEDLFSVPFFIINIAIKHFLFIWKYFMLLKKSPSICTRF